MSKEVKFNISFINHLDQKINLNNYIVDIEAGSIIYDINKSYINLDIVTSKVYYDPKIIGDNIERILVKWQINDNDIQEENFCIEAIDYLKDNNIKVYCRSKSFIYEKNYINDIISGDTLKDLINKIFNLEDITNNFDNFTDFPFIGNLDVSNKTANELIEELRNLYRFEYYYKQKTIYFEDMKSINKDDVAKVKFSEIKDIEEFNTSTDLFKKKVNEIRFNDVKTKDYSINKDKIETLLKLDISPEPQPCSPDEVLTYTDDDGNTYKIPVRRGIFYVYYAPAYQELPQINISATPTEKVIVEKYQLDDEDKLYLNSNIATINGVEGVDNYTFEKGRNILYFDKKYSGEVKVSYKSLVLKGNLDYSKYPGELKIKITFKDRFIDFNHKYVLDGYYPIPYEMRLNTISDWGITAEDGINQNINISKYDPDSKSFTSTTSTSSDAFGDFYIDLESYGTYRFDINNQEPLFLDYFVNKMQIYMNEVNC